MSAPPAGAPTVVELAGVADRRLRRLELTITRRLDGLLRGQHSGLVPGGGTELAGSREYRPGEDDARRLDWAVTARTAVPHVRQTIADRELSVHVVVDTSASMDFGTADLEKRDLAVGVVAAVGFLTSEGGNRLGADVVGAHRVTRIPARPGRAHLLGILRTLLNAPRTPASAQPGGGVKAALDSAFRSMRRRGLVVVVSDFLDDLGEPGQPGEPAGFSWERGLRRLAARHQVLVVEVLDPRELTLPDVGVITLVDPESGRRREISTGDRGLRERYAQAAGLHRAAVARAVRKTGAQHLVLRTDRDWVADVVRHVQGQKLRRTAR